MADSPKRAHPQVNFLPVIPKLLIHERKVL